MNNIGTYTLNNGLKIPRIGFGTWMVRDGGEGADIIRAALDCGYSHIDTAGMYGNEKAVGVAIKGYNRENLFITSKLNNPIRGYKQTLAEIERELGELKTDYLDLYLIHWPRPIAFRDRWEETNAESWAAFEELYGKGVLKSIGVSNFLPHHLEALYRTAKIEPMVNQLEMHPRFFQREAYDYCEARGVLVEAWSPLVRGAFNELPLIAETAAKYGKTSAQLCLRWSVQMNMLPLPKTSKRERMLENADIFNFEISTEDMDRLSALHKDDGNIGYHPDKAAF